MAAFQNCQPHIVLYPFFIYNDFAMLDSQPILALNTETEN